MAKHTLSLHLTDNRKERLDALIAHSEYEGHGKQSEFLRALIDSAAEEHSEVDYNDPDSSIEDEEWRYDPIRHDEILTKEQVREILNTERSPAINPEHCPPMWDPRDKSKKAVLMAAYYRYYKHDSDISTGEIWNNTISQGIGTVAGDSAKINEYKSRVRTNLETYGETPSNLIFVDHVIPQQWISNISSMLEEDDVTENMIETHLEVGGKIVSKLEQEGETKLLEEVETILMKLRQKKNTDAQ